MLANEWRGIEGIEAAIAAGTGRFSVAEALHRASAGRESGAETRGGQFRSPLGRPTVDRHCPAARKSRTILAHSCGCSTGEQCPAAGHRDQVGPRQLGRHGRRNGRGDHEVALACDDEGRDADATRPRRRVGVHERGELALEADLRLGMRVLHRQPDELGQPFLQEAPRVQPGQQGSGHLAHREGIRAVEHAGRHEREPGPERQPKERIEQHDRPDVGWLLGGQLRRDEPAEGVTHDVDRARIRRPQHRQHVLREVTEGVGDVGDVAAPGAAGIEDEHPPLLGKRGDHTGPEARVGGEARNEDAGGFAGSVLLVVEVHPGWGRRVHSAQARPRRANGRPERHAARQSRSGQG